MSSAYFSDNEKMKKCNVCARDIPASARTCKYCGWVQHAQPVDPDKQYWDYNFVTLTKARQLYAAGKPIQPDFGDFLKCMQVYSELEFYCHDKHYGVLHLSDGTWHFYEWDISDKGYQIYKSIEEFAEKANIDNVLLKVLWDSVHSVGLAS